MGPFQSIAAALGHRHKASAVGTLIATSSFLMSSIGSLTVERIVTPSYIFSESLRFRGRKPHPTVLTSINDGGHRTERCRREKRSAPGEVPEGDR
ncbi:MAG: hypothetical protein DHS20C21_14360 [Gemmatimonadota bacterium]|nr:MAG: hypothetical protein DHS20C21_14360 [Gemmatimonadota bacterium]